MAVENIRFRRLGYIALNVTDLQASRHFYESLVGLKIDNDQQDGPVFLRCSDKHHDLVLYSADVAGVKRVGWHMESSDALSALHDHLVSKKVECVPVPEEECKALGIQEAFRISEPTTRATFEFYSDMLPAPTRYEATHTKIARLGHIVLSSPDRPATEKFMIDVLNFRVSDRIDGMVTFMRCFPNPYHHSFGIGAAAKPGLNHINFMVTELADVGKATNRMKQNDVPIVYGIGKHPPSESYFLYFLDPDEMTVEYSFGMEEFPEHNPRAPREMPATLDSVDYWGGVPDPRSGKYGELEALSPGRS